MKVSGGHNALHWFDQCGAVFVWARSSNHVHACGLALIEAKRDAKTEDYLKKRREKVESGTARLRDTSSVITEEDRKEAKRINFYLESQP